MRTPGRAPARRATAPEPDAVLLAEAVHQRFALDAEARLVGAGPVVDARVDDARVVTGLVRREPRVLFQEDEARARGALVERPGGGEAHDAAADDRDVVGHGALL